MYLFFDRNGTLKEQITVSPPRYGDENVNAIHVYWDNEVTQSITKNSVYCRYKKPNGSYTLNLLADDVVNEPVPYDPNRDLKFFNYNQNYRFYVFNIPSDIFAELENVDVYTVLFSCWFIYNTNQQKTMGLVAFAVEPSTQSVALDQNINIAQWNALINMLTGTADLTNIDVLSITFKESENPSETGLSMKDNVIYWRGAKLVTPSDLNAYVTTSTAQNISGYKTFLSGIGLENAPLEIENGSEVPLGVFTVHDDDNETNYNIKADGGADGATHDIKLPNKSGRLAVSEDTVNLTGNQEIFGNKTFRSAILESLADGTGIFSVLVRSPNKADYVNLKLKDPNDLNYNIIFPQPSADGDVNLLDTDALKPTILTPNVAAEGTVTLAGGLIPVTIESGGGTGTATGTIPVIEGFEIAATLVSGSAELTIDQTTGEYTLTGNNGVYVISYNYEATKVKFTFAIGSDYNGLYVFTHSYLTMLVPIYSLTEGKMYKFPGVGLQDADGSTINMVHNMVRNGTNLTIWSGNSDYPFIAGRTGYLSKVKLY